MNEMPNFAIDYELGFMTLQGLVI